MCTSRLGNLGSVDLGAQHYSFDSHDSLSNVQKEFISDLVKNKVLEEYSSKRIVNCPKHYLKSCNYVASGSGNREIIQFFVKQLNGMEDIALEKNYTATISDYSIYPADGTSRSPFVISTIPMPQFIALVKSDTAAESSLQPIVSQLNKIEYSCRICLGILSSSSQTPPEHLIDRSTYIDNSNIRYISVHKHDSNEINQTDSPPVYTTCVHSNVKFALEHLDHEKEEAGKVLLDELIAKYPEYRVNDGQIVKFHKWRYSQIYKNEDFKGKGYFKVSDGLVLTGDAFAKESNVLGCVDAAYQTAQFVANALNTN